MDDTTVKVGLLLEAAESHQAMSAAALERLQQHTAGLDVVVRDEIRAILTEELRGLDEDSQRAARSLRELARRADRRLFAVGVAVAAFPAAVGLALAWWLLPGPREIEALRASRDALTSDIAHLKGEGGAVQLGRCGSAHRLCVRIEPAAPRYGQAADYLVLKGY